MLLKRLSQQVCINRSMNTNTQEPGPVAMRDEMLATM
jgi:hypothetical protein